MTHYIIYFNQQWVGEHTEEWFRGRGPLARAVLEEMKSAGVFVFGGGLDEDRTRAFTAHPTGGTVTITDGPVTDTGEYLGGLTLIDVPDESAARMWAGKVAEACGWAQEVRRITP